MRKILICVLLVILSFGRVFGQNDKTKLEEEGIKGKVKLLIEKRYWAKKRFGKIKKQKLHLSEYELYNSMGNVLERGSYDTKDYVFIYDELGRLNKTEEYDISGKEVVGKSVYEYDDWGNNIKMTNYNSDGTVAQIVAYKYDSLGNMIERRQMSTYMTTSSKILYEYDKQRNEVVRKYYNQAEKLTDKWTYKYDENGNNIESNIYDSQEQLESKWLSKYNEYGDEIEYYWYKPPENLLDKVIYQYEYDDMGNWTKKILIRKHLYPKYAITEREITYYD